MQCLLNHQATFVLVANVCTKIAPCASDLWRPCKEEIRAACADFSRGSKEYWWTSYGRKYSCTQPKC